MSIESEGDDEMVCDWGETVCDWGETVCNAGEMDAGSNSTSTLRSAKALLAPASFAIRPQS